MSLASGAVHVGLETLEMKVSGSSFLHPAAKTVSTVRTAINSLLDHCVVRPVFDLLEFFAGNVIFFIVANNYYVLIFDDLVRTIVILTKDNRRLQ